MKSGGSGLMLTNKVFYVVIAALVLVAMGMYIVEGILGASSIASPNPGHNSNQIYLKIGGYYVTLQHAIDNNYINGLSVPKSSDPIVGTSAMASQVLITIGGQTMTLQQAFDTGALITGVPKAGYKYTSHLISYDNASLINVKFGTSIMTLQKAAWEKKFCVSNAGASCGGNVCTNPGTIQCDGSCADTSFKPKGTNCNAAGTYACDGAGHCLGWSGTGCGGCRWGVGSYSCSNGVCYFCKLNGNQGRYYVLATGYSAGHWAQWGWFGEKSALCKKKYCASWVSGICTKWKTTNYNWQIKP